MPRVALFLVTVLAVAQGRMAYAQSPGDAQPVADAATPAGAAPGEEPADGAFAQPLFTYGSEVDLNARYLWRGAAYSEGAVTQPAAWAGLHGFTLATWANLPVGGTATPGRLDELDFSLAWSGEWAGVSLSPMLQAYTYPGVEDAPPTLEASMTFERAVGPLALSMLHSVDVGAYPGAYFAEARLAAGVDLSPSSALETGMDLGWGSGAFNAAYFGVEESTLALVQGDLGLTWSHASGLYVRPHLEVAVLLDDDLRRAVGARTHANLGVALGIER